MNQFEPTPSYGYNYSPLIAPRHMTLPFRRTVRKSSNAIGLCLILLEVLMVGLYFLLNWAFSSFAADFGPAQLDLLDESISLVSYIIGFWVPTLILTAWIGIPANVAFPTRAPKADIAIPAVFVALASGILGSILVSLIETLLESVGLVATMPDIVLPEGIGANIVFTLSLTVAPAIFEEMLFRGVIMQSLRRFGDGFALVSSAVLFGLIHGNLIQGPNAVLLGLVIGYFVLRTGSIFTGMLIHFVNNGLVVVIMYVSEMLTLEQAEILNLAMVGFYILSGIFALIFLVVRHRGMFRLYPSDYPLTRGQKAVSFYFAPAQIFFLLMIFLLTAMTIQ